MNINERLNQLFENPNKEDILYFLKTRQREDVEALYRFADDVREQFAGDAVHLWASIEFSNRCKQKCLYCGINMTNKTVKRYRMEPDEIVAAAREAYQAGYKTVVLQSGEDPDYSRKDYRYIIREIKKCGVQAITLSIGEKTRDDYRAYYNAGADGFLLKHETSDSNLYDAFNPERDLKNRIRHLKSLETIGFRTGGGIMIGLPAQTPGSIADDILLFKKLDLDMIDCGPFIPHPDTPLGQAESGSEELTCRVLALNRIVTRDTHLPVTTSLSPLDETGARKLALQRGANVIMPNLTPLKYRLHYEIYPNKNRINIDPEDYRKELETLITSLGRHITGTPGPAARGAFMRTNVGIGSIAPCHTGRIVNRFPMPLGRRGGMVIYPPPPVWFTLHVSTGSEVGIIAEIGIASGDGAIQFISDAGRDTGIGKSPTFQSTHLNGLQVGNGFFVQ